MGTYCELLDTAWIKPAERAAGRSILMLRALERQPCELAAVHAIASDLVLDDCAADKHFLSLVEEGRIRFRLRKEGMDIRSALIESFRDTNYRMDTWPGIWPTPDSPEWAEARERRQAAVAVIEKRANATGDDALDARLSRTKDLLASIELANYKQPERRHGPQFANWVRNARTYLRPEYTDVADWLEGVVVKLEADRVVIDRSSLYTAIENDGPVRFERPAKNLIDSLKVRAMAWSLDEELISLHRDELEKGAYERDADVVQAGVEVTELDAVAARQMKDLDSLQLEWANVAEAAKLLTGKSPSKNDLALAHEKLLAIVVEKRIASPSRDFTAVANKGAAFATAAVGSAAATGMIVTTLQGTMGVAAASLLTGLVAVSGAVATGRAVKRGSDALKARLKEDTKRKLDVWLGDRHSDET